MNKFAISKAQCMHIGYLAELELFSTNLKTKVNRPTSPEQFGNQLSQPQENRTVKLNLLQVGLRGSFASHRNLLVLPTSTLGNCALECILERTGLNAISIAEKGNVVVGGYGIATQVRLRACLLAMKKAVG
ncbi:hypothetical protein E2542_SST17342 [Spatholobus suberectus]|nr:hypothetical protein E2542_SST17342 [Spatholobus suberectus]